MSIFAFFGDKGKYNLGNDSDLVGIADGTAFGSIKALAAMISGIENAATASRTYNAGEYILRNGEFYEVTTTIASGTVITVGVNIQKTTIGEALSTLDSGKLKTTGTISADISVSSESELYKIGKYLRENFQAEIYASGGMNFQLIPTQTPAWYTGIIYTDNPEWVSGATAWGFFINRDSNKWYKYNAGYGGADTVTPFSALPVYQSVYPTAGSFWRYDNQGRALQVAYAGDTTGGSDSGNSYYGQCFIEMGTPSITQNGNTITITVPEVVYASNRFGQVGGGTYQRNITITCTT